MIPILALYKGNERIEISANYFIIDRDPGQSLLLFQAFLGGESLELLREFEDEELDYF